MQYTEKDVAKLIADVEKAFTAQLVKADEVSLAKSEDGEKDHKEKEEHEEKPEHEEHEAPKHEAKDGESEAYEEGKEHEEKHAPEGEKHEGHEAHDYDEEDMAHMEKMYRSMSKGEIAAHHDCIKKCMGSSEAKPAEMEKAEKPKDMGDEGHKSGGEMSACAPKDGPGAKSEASNAHGDKMEKSENKEVELLKSELSAEKAKFVAVQEFLTKFAKKVAPQGKAITSLDVIAKSEVPSEEKVLTKAQITEILNKKTADPSLKKSDRDAVTSYYLNNQLNVNSISHLLK
jgi:hypothetical protein